MKREISFLLLLCVLGLANMGFNIFNWHVTGHTYSVEITGNKLDRNSFGLKGTLNYDLSPPKPTALSSFEDTASLNNGFFSKQVRSYNQMIENHNP